MIRLDLNQNWKMREAGSDAAEYIPAVVPGTVYTDLLREGQMEDPFWKDNEDEALRLMDKDYEYVTSFDCPEELLSCERVLLHFDGVDTIADVFLNGSLLGSPCNMHRVWEYEVKSSVWSRLKPEENELRVLFHSPTKYIAEKYAERPTRGTEDAMDGFVHIRKAHCMFGWDWGAHLPDAGLFRPVSLLGIQTARIDSVYVTQKHEDGKVVLHLDTKTDWNMSALPLMMDKPRNYSFQATVTGPDGKVYYAEGSVTGQMDLVIDQPQLWWPNGYGEQNLYTVSVEMIERRCEDTSEVAGSAESIAQTEAGKDINGATGADGTSDYVSDNKTQSAQNTQNTQSALSGQNALSDQNVPGENPDEIILDTWTRRIGLRTMTMHREKDQWGESFACQVNGVDIFSMGADYIPEDHLLGRVTEQTTRTLLEKAKWANFNAIRVWGGGYYPDDWFYDACDELGLVVWQDFMFACAVYDLTPEFEENIRAEFADNIKRLRHHASLGLWCGNNEMESFVAERNSWVTKPQEVRDYLFMYERVIPEELKKYDPQTFYWPSSPSSGGCFDDPQDPNRGDVHYWQVWHGDKPFTEYRKYYFRYLSEFGFQSFPAMKTIEQISDDPADYNIFSYIMEKHQRNGSANGKIMNYMQQTYRYPSDFQTVLYASQLLQADGIRYGVEHFRRNRGRCMGAIYWQLNDCWPVASWSSIDYCGRLKALHYYAKRFFAPLMLSCEEQGLVTSGKELVREHFDFEKSIRLNVANETMQEKMVTVRWALRDPSAKVLQSGETVLTVPALTSVWLDKIEFPDADIYREYVSYELEKDGEIVSEGTVNFSYPKYFRYEDPLLTCRVVGDEIEVTASAYAKSVEIRNENEDLILSDNYFDMNAGTKRVRIESGDASKLRLRSVYDIR
ncbi:MAG: glycoside hydrolase family 2 protein [Lachnospiraceae bacterium]|nr:glycoside hydrolase family 2 protein [Lachnospiraceae bacterium]